MRRLTSLEKKVADLIIDLRKSEHMRVPSPNKIQRIVEMLEEEVWKSCARSKSTTNDMAEIVSFTGTPRECFNMFLRTSVSTLYINMNERKRLKTVY